MAIQSPSSPAVFRTQGVTFSGGGSFSGAVQDKPDVFERQSSPAHPQPERPAQSDAFAWVKDLIAEARTNPHASLPELLHVSEIKRRTNALLEDVRQTPALSGILSKKDFKSPHDVPDDLDALISQVDQDMGQFDLMLRDLHMGRLPSLPVQDDDHPLASFMPVKPSVLNARFAQETADLKARQLEENAAQAKKYGIQDTPELRKALLDEGAVASEDEIPAFLQRFGL